MQLKYFVWVFALVLLVGGVSAEIQDILIWEDDFSILGVAFIWKDFDHMLKVVQGPIGQEMMDKLIKSTGVKVLDMGWIDGQRHFNTNKPIRTPDDVVGLKIRVPEVPIYFSNMKAMGASVVAMPFSEVFTSVQTGVIDGQENPLDSIYANKFYEITKYVSLSAHVTQNLAIIINNDRFNKMPKDLQDILVNLSTKVVANINENLFHNIVSFFKKIKNYLMDKIYLIYGTAMVGVGSYLTLIDSSILNIEDTEISQWISGTVLLLGLIGLAYHAQNKKSEKNIVEE